VQAPGFLTRTHVLPWLASQPLTGSRLRSAPSLRSRFTDAGSGPTGRGTVRGSVPPTEPALNARVLAPLWGLCEAVGWAGGAPVHV